MMRTEIAGEFPDHRSDQSSIVKGKRTKRPRPSTSSSVDDSHNSSPEPSSGISTSTKEDEDMANCLILLARGDTPPPPPQIKTNPPAATGGVYVYECKTCNRAFQSFQALGGHRASHKRPKPDQEAADENSNSKLSCAATPPPPKSPGTDKIKANKIHGCSICGAEFASGQALGGHMRRHRAPPPTEKPLALDLDLNLPAPPEADDNYNQQPRMVFSAAALVDCHY